MTNPVFTRNKVFTRRTPAGYPGTSDYQVGQSGAPFASTSGSRATYPPPAYPQEAFPGAQPEVAATGTRPVTLDDVLIKLVFTSGTLLVGGALAWFITITNPGLGATLSLGGMVIVLVSDMINAFKSRPSPALILGYAFFEGLMLGAVSQLFSAAHGGVVPKAIGATIVTALVMFVLLKTNIVCNSPTLIRVVFIGIDSLFMFYLVNFVVSLIFPAVNFYDATLFGFPLWTVVSLVAIALAALSLVTDFDYTFQAVEDGAPAKTAWTCAFDLMVTLVWLYIEFLRIFAYIASAASDNWIRFHQVPFGILARFKS